MHVKNSHICNFIIIIFAVVICIIDSLVYDVKVKEGGRHNKFDYVQKLFY